MTGPVRTPRPHGSRKVERILGILAVGAIASAWILGFVRGEADVLPSLAQAVPEAERFEPLGGRTYAAWAGGSEEALLGYVKIASTMGYGGPMQVAVAGDTNGRVIGIAVVDHKETPSFFKRLSSSDLISSLEGKAYDDGFILGKDVDAVSGATLSARAATESVARGIRDVAGRRLGFDVAEEERVRIRFAVPEMVLIALFAAGFAGRLKGSRFKKFARWSSLIAGLLLLGFVYGKPLTLSKISQFMLGFWPQWQTELYWYLLMGGIVIFFVVDKRNPYCHWFCPFGAAQECLGAIGIAKARPRNRYGGLLKWLQRILALAAIIIALLYRNPGMSSYEVSGTLFELVGSTYQLVVLGMVLVASLFILRPWCTFLCPIRPVEDFFRMTERWVKETWRRTRPGPGS